LTFDLLEAPQPELAAKTIQSALQQEKFIIVVGRCTVRYKGRATSSLDTGERLLAIKQDRALLIHRPYGYQPVNWQPPGCRFEISTDNDELRIRAIRRSPPETISVSFDQLKLIAAMALKDLAEFFLDASEEDMQRAIIARPEIVERGLRVIEYEKRVEPGFVDVYGIDQDGRLVIIEIKRKAAGREAIFQLAKYVKATSEGVGRSIRPILVAPSIAKGIQRLLQTMRVEFRKLDPKQCAKILAEVDKGEEERLSRWI